MTTKPNRTDPKRRLSTSVNRRSAVPLYVQVREALESQIDSQGWSPGDRIPSEPELCRLFGVSRPVVRQALQEMAHDGLLTRRKGLGTFVAEPRITTRSLVHSLVGFFQEMEAKGMTPVTDVREQAMQPAGPRVGAQLRLDPSTPVVKVTRLRYVQDEPVVLVTSFLPYELCPDLISADLRHQSLYAFLQGRYGLTVSSGKRTIEAALAGEQDAALLRIAPGSPVLRLESVSYLADGRPMEYFHGLFRSAFEVELGPAGSAPVEVPPMRFEAEVG
ncbi:MAG TPA: GntR family transcriptional regulator [Anaerolineales bacterium]|nr:GntR family transcriptional regulator [Anaerolineales bacterium]